MGGFLGIGHSSAKTDRGNTLKGYDELQNVFNYGMDTSKKANASGTATTQAGLEDLGTAGGYWKKLLSGDRATQMQAVAPETNAVAQQGDATRRAQAEIGGARGGGTNAVAQQQQDAQMQQIDNLLFGARPAAAGQVAQIGGKEADIGGAELTRALQALGISGSSADDLTKDSMESRKTSYAINKAMQSQIQGIVSDLAKSFLVPGGGGSDA